MPLLLALVLALISSILILISGFLIGYAVGRREARSGLDWRDVFDDSDEAGA